MKVRWALPLLVTMVMAALSSQAWAQVPTPAGGPPMGYGPPGGAPGPMYPPASPAYAPGNSFLSPPQGAEEMQGPPPGMDPGAMGGEGMGGGGECSLCGGAGCPHCASGNGPCGPGLFANHGLCDDLFGWLLPYPDGGCAAPRWYDFSFEYMHLKRDNMGQRVDFTSAGIAGPIVLSSDNFDFDESNSFRFTAMVQAGPGSNFEFNYFGLHFFDSQAAVVDPTNNLFSTISNFGTNPFFGFVETDESDFQSISYNSDFDNFEVNFRQRWNAPNGRYQGSWLAGVRYFKLDEEFTLFTSSDTIFGVQQLVPNNATFKTDVSNNLTGGQVGGDIWMCIIPGIKLGGEAKAGVYGNHVSVNNIITTSGGGAFNEPQVETDVAFVGDANLQGIYRINQHFTLKVGYTFLYVEGVSLAPQNFNAVPPQVLFNNGGNRVATINDDSHVFYHGATVGFEFLW